MITAIDPRSVDQITSGQVIVSMPNAIKELVENSLDAGATVVEVSAINYCIDGFAVQDNGSGIAEADFPMVAKKHTTSKLSSFGDLDSIATLGFRGEALASLCALATVEITTSTGSGGHYLRFNNVGDVIEQKQVPSPKGTVVNVTNLFATAPVRRKDFVAHAKREWQKMISMIQVYGLISPVRLTVDNVVKAKKTNSLRCQGDSLEKRIAAIYGNSAAHTIMPVQLVLENCEVVGAISEPTFGKGRTGSDRQVVYVNGRPSDQTKIARTVTEIYQLYNHTEVPSFVLDVKLKPSLYDVNVSPDKRTILLHDEAHLLGQLRDAFVQLFDNTTHTVPRAMAEPLAKKPKRQTLLSLNHFAGAGNVIQQGSSSDEEMEVDTTPPSKRDPRGIDQASPTPPEIVIPIERPTSRQRPATAPNNSRIGSTPGFILASELGSLASDQTPEAPHPPVPAPVPESISKLLPEHLPELLPEDSEVAPVVGMPATRPPEPVARREIRSDPPRGPSHELAQPSPRRVNAPSVPASLIHKVAEYPSPAASAAVQPLFVDDPVVDLVSKGSDNETHLPEPPVIESRLETESCCNHDTEQPSSAVLSEGTQKSSDPKSEGALNCHITVPTSLADIKATLATQQPRKANKFKHYAIDQEDVERRLTLSVHKEDFSDMRIIGQFNLGFIVVVKSTANSDDIFVIDQHASDEIFNFEKLQNTTVLNRQPLVVPQVLELSVMEELTVANHLDVFENNGFGIVLKPDEPPGRQCRLTALPFSKDTIFTEKDIHELLYKIQENPSDKTVKCAKLRAMHAMRACRKSIMIGRPLTMNKMREVVTNLGTLHRPWNCPHGRPTLRHITRLS